MSVDLLKKLVRLATNNPNEHEANLAARRVCMLLMRDDFALLRTAHPPTTPPRTATEYTRTQAQAEPSVKGEWTSQPYSTVDQATWDELLKRMGFDFNSRTNSYSNSGSRTQYARYQAYETPFNYSEQTSNDKREIRCVKCRELKQTRFRGEASIWVCIECRGKEYQNKEQEGK